jgi:hypothetical protein
MSKAMTVKAEDLKDENGCSETKLFVLNSSNEWMEVTNENILDKQVTDVREKSPCTFQAALIRFLARNRYSRQEILPEFMEKLVSLSKAYDTSRDGDQVLYAYHYPQPEVSSESGIKEEIPDSWKPGWYPAYRVLGNDLFKIRGMAHVSWIPPSGSSREKEHVEESFHVFSPEIKMDTKVLEQLQSMERICISKPNYSLKKRYWTRKRK